MSEQKQRGGPGRGQGRKALAGEVRKVRPFKATDAEWEDFKLVTPEKVRQWVAKQAAKLRKAEEPNALGEGRERGILREASSGEAATSTVVLEGGVPKGEK